MSDITPNTFVSATATDADAVNQNFYGTLGTSLSEVNGRLNAANLHVDAQIGNEHVRNRTAWNGRMASQTGVLDYSYLLFNGDESTPDQYIGIPGASVSFYLPEQPTLLVCTWQVSGATDQEMTTIKDRNLKFFFDGDAQPQQDRKLAASKINSSHATTALRGLRMTHRDRIWSGAKILTTSDMLSVGWHTAWVGVHVHETESVRIRVRNIKVLWFY